MAGMAIFIIGSLVATFAVDFTTLLAARTVQGIGAAAPRVIAFAMVHDHYSGREMARVMSFAIAVFIIIPVLAPSMGQGLIFIGSWRLMFDLLLVAGIIIAVFAGLRLPRRASSRGRAVSFPSSPRLTLETRQTIVTR